MNKDHYSFSKSIAGNFYFFISQGVYGNITKSVSIEKMQNIVYDGNDLEIYNLAFGDLGVLNGEWTINDINRSNNGDMAKVIATVSKIAMEFMNENQSAILSFSGSMDTKSFSVGRNQRNNLYQRAINSNFQELCKSFDIIGVRNNHRENYNPGTEYDTILIKCKK